MIEIEVMLNELKRLREKEKSIRNRILLENAYNALMEYEKAAHGKER